MIKFIKQLDDYLPKDDQEIIFKKQMLRLIKEQGENAFLRSSIQAHFTASAWLIDKVNKKVLLLKHSKLNKWLQPGGHADGLSDLEEVARKEVQEETNLTNITLLKNGIFDIDIHKIPERKEVKEHEHYDVRFIFEVLDSTATKINNESIDFKWIALESLQKYTDSQSILRMAEKTKKYFTHAS
ncbi:NUDIX hydrolase [Marivirga lumbricoides]|uniref:NUDIX hydrolase n=1 Tax=Marivirga lumbricoides TaxID=1046115 RepID=A0A2T4DUW2_9BACT|nr:NUDIX hydrolase [Marivirga lumbricoides]GGC20965.1 NUDIX hydrolase [Marivirga lumbricoides]